MTTSDFPPRPPELAMRIVGDTAEHVPFPVDAVARRVADGLRDDEGRASLISVEELTRAHVDDLWAEERLASSYARALAAVRDAYLAQADLVARVMADLDARGPDSWIAGALAHQFAERAAWEALDRLGELMELPAEPLCASCGALLADDPTGEA